MIIMNKIFVNVVRGISLIILDVVMMKIKNIIEVKVVDKCLMLLDLMLICDCLIMALSFIVLNMLDIVFVMFCVMYFCVNLLVVFEVLFKILLMY